MKNTHIFLTILFAIFFVNAGMVAKTNLDQEPWVVPGKYKKMQNPTDPADKEGEMIAKRLWAKHCKSCHGTTGLGDGSKAAELDTPSGDFSTKDFQAQSDGDLYYKTVFGRGDMPAYDKKVPEEEDRWLLVNYMRTFAK